jgi:hypothetical protein
MTLSDLLNTMLPIEEDRPLCQNPPSPRIEIARFLPAAIKGRVRGGAKTIAHRLSADLERGQAANR